MLVNQLSVFLKTKREVNRALEEIRFLLKKRVKQRLNAKRMQAIEEKKGKACEGTPDGSEKL